jgi:phage-related minor tail protein
LTYKEKYQGLLGRYKDIERAVLEAQASKKAAGEQKKELERKIKTLLKLKVFTPEEAEKVLQKLEKEIETRLNVLAERVQEYEQELSEFKTEDGLASSDDMNTVLEDL